jgi:hypothetical protein
MEELHLKINIYWRKKIMYLIEKVSDNEDKY